MYLSFSYCHVCGKETFHADGNCSDCAKKASEEALEKWKSKTLEEKLLDLHLRLKRIENRGFSSFCS